MQQQRCRSKQNDSLSNSNQQSEEYQQLGVPGEDKFTSSVSQTWSNINHLCSKSVRTLNGLAMNLAYNVKHSSCPWIQRKPIILQQNGQPAFLLGKRYTKKDNQTQFYEDFQSIIWFSYRSENQDRITDAGWGCMIRVCQMMLAQVLKRCCKNRLHSSEIFKEFLPTPSAIYSFDNICEEGNILQRWTSSAQILGILIQLTRRQKKYKLCIQLYNSVVGEEDLKAPQDYPLLLTTSNRVGEKNICMKYSDHILALLEHKTCVGMIGGIGGQAVYITGHLQENLILLDPHYVQPEEEGKNIHFKKTPRGVHISSIVPSIVLCNYFQDRKQHELWIQDMAELCQFHRPNMAIEIDEQYCRKIFLQRRRFRKQSSDEEFQILQ